MNDSKIYPAFFYPYHKLDDLECLPKEFYLADHINGFDQNFKNKLLDKIDSHAHDVGIRYKVLVHEFYPEYVTQNYKNIDIIFDPRSIISTSSPVPVINYLLDYKIHPPKRIDKFLSCFNGSPHVSRFLIVAILDRMGYFDPETCTKCFSITADIIDGNLSEICSENSRFYRKFFLGDNSEHFLSQRFEVGDHPKLRSHHLSNIKLFEKILSRSFVNIVSETLATSYVPFVTEKLAYPVTTRTLFLAWAQPGWHDHIESVYGFRLYKKIFNYQFDSINNPVERLIAMIDMLNKFSKLTVSDWKDLYDYEKETIEFNYDHYMSGDCWNKLVNRMTA